MSIAAMPDIYQAIIAKQHLDAELCKVLAFVVPVPGHEPQSIGTPAQQYIAARVSLARKHLAEFELALKGVARDA